MNEKYMLYYIGRFRFFICGFFNFSLADFRLATKKLRHFRRMRTQGFLKKHQSRDQSHLILCISKFTAHEIDPIRKFSLWKNTN